MMPVSMCPHNLVVSYVYKDTTQICSSQELTNMKFEFNKYNECQRVGVLEMEIIPLLLQ